MKRIFILSYLLTFLFSVFGYSQEDLSIVPYPKDVKLQSGNFSLKEGFSVSAPKSLQSLANLFIHDMYKLYQIKGVNKKGKASVTFCINKNMVDQCYQLTCTNEGISIIGKDYNNVSLGVTTLLQLVDFQKNVPCVEIKDTAALEYRTFMLDVARHPISIETVKQCIELCRWYKIRYLQLHLNDDPLFTFPSKTYLQLAKGTPAYSLEELKNLVKFAHERGIVIIPEFDTPGHSLIMRTKMPKLFGEPELLVIDMTKSEVIEAVENIMKEIMEIFYDSPYFHIGGDEAELTNFAKEKHVKQYIKDKGYDNVYDIYIEYITRMHEYVKKNGKQTLVWDNFIDRGKDKISIPKDVQVLAYSTCEQSPKSLIKNGYTIINGSWKPFYVCPHYRWNQECIYSWNIHKWERPFTPNYRTPTQLDDKTYIKGTQMCSWEMDDANQISSLHQRIPAFSEIAWYEKAPSSYDEFLKRYYLTDNKFMNLIFPVNMVKVGFNQPDLLYGLDHNAENCFRENAEIDLKSILPDTYITCTTDGTMPKSSSTHVSHIILRESQNLRIGVFDANNEMIGYNSTDYFLKPIEVAFEGNIEPVRDRNLLKNKENFKDRILIKLNSSHDTVIRYTLDGTQPTNKSQIYPQGGIFLDRTAKLRAQCFKKGKTFGEPYICEFINIK